MKPPGLTTEPLSHILLTPLAERATRLCPLIQKQIEDATTFAASQPGNESLWAQLRLTVANILQSLFLQGAFAGSRPADAYYIRCDASTTTQHDIDLGRVNLVVGFAPIKPAEFTILNICLQAEPPIPHRAILS